MDRVDWPVFSSAVLLLGLVTIPLAIAPDASSVLVSDVYGWLASTLGPIYLASGVASLLFVAWLAASKYGRVVLGPDDGDPEYSAWSWFSMLFCAGIASGVLYWGVIEWAYYYQAPPEGVVPLSGEALEWAASYPLFHWGFTAWAFYALPTVAVAYSCHRGGEASYRLSAACRPLIGDRADSATGRAIDVLFIVGILGGASTSLGLSTPLIAQGVTQLTGMERWFGLDVAIVLGCGLIFATSVYLGLDRGIRTLSNLNLGLALGFVIFVVAAGDSGFILQTGIGAVGHVVRHFVWMNLWNDPVLQTDWTVFYWAWWIAYAPFVGLFVARISRGRSIRQVVLGMLLLGTAGSWVFFIALGSYAMSLEVAGVLPVVDLVNSAGAPAAIIAVISTLPAAQATVGLFCLIALLYLATTFDSAAYTIAAGASSGLGASGHPPRAHRSFWAVAVGALPIALMSVGGLKSLQTASLVASVPLLAIGGLLAWSLVRALRSERRGNAEHSAE